MLRRLIERQQQQFLEQGGIKEQKTKKLIPPARYTFTACSMNLKNQTSAVLSCGRLL